MLESDTKKEKKIKDQLEDLKVDNFTSDIRHYNFAAARPAPQLTPGGLGDSYKDPKKQVLRFQFPFKDLHKLFDQQVV